MTDLRELGHDLVNHEDPKRAYSQLDEIWSRADEVRCMDPEDVGTLMGEVLYWVRAPIMWDDSDRRLRHKTRIAAHDTWRLLAQTAVEEQTTGVKYGRLRRSHD